MVRQCMVEEKLSEYVDTILQNRVHAEVRFLLATRMRVPLCRCFGLIMWSARCRCFVLRQVGLVVGHAGTARDFIFFLVRGPAQVIQSLTRPKPTLPPTRTH